MKTIKKALIEAITYLQDREFDNPQKEAKELLSLAIGEKMLDLYLDLSKPLSQKQCERFANFLQRRGEMEPLGYIAKEVDFYGVSLRITKDVLIPRSETEQLVDKIVNELENDDLDDKVLWDLCTGSGAIAIAVKKVFPELRVIASDVSQNALDLACENAKRNGVEIEWVQGDFLQPFMGQKAHFITCNPPYISEEEYLELTEGVKNYEPLLALVAKDEGLEFYCRLQSSLEDVLLPRGKIFLEIGFNQKEAVNKIFSTTPKISSNVSKDFAGHDRFFFLEIE